MTVLEYCIKQKNLNDELYSLSPRIRNLLSINNIYTIEDLKNYDIDQLRKKPKIGIKTIKEILKFIQENI